MFSACCWTTLKAWREASSELMQLGSSCHVCSHAFWDGSWYCLDLWLEEAHWCYWVYRFKCSLDWSIPCLKLAFCLWKSSHYATVCQWTQIQAPIWAFHSACASLHCSIESQCARQGYFERLSLLVLRCCISRSLKEYSTPRRTRLDPSHEWPHYWICPVWSAPHSTSNLHQHSQSPTW